MFEIVDRDDGNIAVGLDELCVSNATPACSAGPAHWADSHQ